MSLSPYLARAVMAGFAAPAALYAPTQPYWAYLGGSSVARTFGMVGSALTLAAGRGVIDVGAESTAPERVARSG